MAWISASLALMALGFVIDRFELILRQVMPTTRTGMYGAFSFWAGAMPVIMGSVMALTATVRYVRFSISYNRESSTHPRQGVLVGAFFSAAVAILGIIIAVFLFMMSE